MSARILARPVAASADRLSGILLLAFTGCAWGFTWPVNKYLLALLPPFSMRAAPVAIGVVFAFAVAAIRGESLALPRGQFLWLALLGMLNYGAFTVATTLALVRLDASVAVLITYTLPVWATLLAWPVLGERPKPRGIAALALALIGVALLVGADPTQARHASWIGIGCAFLAAIAFALGTVLGKRRPLRLPPMTGVAWQASFGVLPALALAIPEHADFAALPGRGWLAIAYVATMPMTLAYLTWFLALRRLPAAVASTGVLIAPLVGVLASAMMLGEPLGPRQIVAMAVVLGGVALAAL